MQQAIYKYESNAKYALSGESWYADEAEYRALLAAAPPPQTPTPATLAAAAAAFDEAMFADMEVVLTRVTDTVTLKRRRDE